MPLLQPRLNLKVTQRQILTPGLMQMVSVLALNKLELTEMINAEMINEAPVPLRYASRSPARGNIEAFANWNKKRQPANISRLIFLERLNRSALGGGVNA